MRFLRSWPAAVLIGIGFLLGGSPLTAQTWTWEGCFINLSWSTANFCYPSSAPTNNGTAQILIARSRYRWPTVDANWSISPLMFSNNPKVTTDKSDYAPGCTVSITGTGFQPGETVHNQITQIVGPAAGTNYAPWKVTADPHGGFTTTWLVFGDELLDTTLQLSSRGESSGLEAQTTFTDAANLTVEGGVTNDVTATGVAGALIKVYSDAGLTTQVGSTITTTGSGVWNLTLAKNATFYVVVTPPANYGSSAANTGTTNGAAASSSVSNGELVVSSSNSGGDVSGAAFLVHYTSATETTTASAANATYSTSAQNVTLTATVTSTVGTVNAGSVTFTVKNGSNVIGVALSSRVSSGSASVTYSLPASTPAGAYTIDGVYHTAGGNADGSDNLHNLTVNTVGVTITSGISANNKVYDGTTTATLSSNNVVLAGVLAGDTARVSLSTNGYTATFASAALGSGKAVTVSGLTLTGSASGNYTLTQPSLTANIAKADQTITFGAIADQLTANTVALFATASSGLTVTFAVTSGPGSLSGTNLTLTGAGSVTITASQAGNTNWNAAPDISRSFNVNTLPVPSSPTLGRWPLAGVKVRGTNLLGTDPDGDSVSLVSAGPTSAHGGTITTNATWVFYMPAAGFTNADSYPYIVSDSRGGTNGGTVTINLSTNVEPTQNYTIESLGNGSVTLHFSAIPGRTYAIQFTDVLQPANWQALTTRTADALGRFSCTDMPPGDPSLRFYRTIHITP